MASLRARVQKPSFIIVTDPGPDPDDVKSLLIAATLHKHGKLNLRAVIVNGGLQARERAILARCLIDHLNEPSIPVGIGSSGKEHVPAPHEYQLDGYDKVDPARLEDGPELMLRALREAPRGSLTVVLISSLRDFADACLAEPELVMAKVNHVAVQGGLEKAEEGKFGWKPDTSVNNGFDPEGARIVYDFCFERGLRMSITSRFAVPMLPMQLAKSFAERVDSPVMRYLANAQFLGLEGLWNKLCGGKLPARCSKQWYFETFCGVDKQEFEDKGYDALASDAPIVSYLNGYVKPYDVVALMTALPWLSPIFEGREASVVHEVKGVKHRLFLRVEDAVEVRHVLELLRDTYHEVVAISKGLHKSNSSAVLRRSELGSVGAGGSAASGLAADKTSAVSSRSSSVTSDRNAPLDSPHSPGSSVGGSGRVLGLTIREEGERTGGAGRSAQTSRLKKAALSNDETKEWLEDVLARTRWRQAIVAKWAVALGLAFCLALIIVYVADTAVAAAANSAPRVDYLYLADEAYALRVNLYAVCGLVAVLTGVLALWPSHTQLWRIRAVAFGMGAFGAVVTGARMMVFLSIVDPSREWVMPAEPSAERPAEYWRDHWAPRTALRLVQWGGALGTLLLLLVPLWRKPAALIRAIWRGLALFGLLEGGFALHVVAMAVFSPAGAAGLAVLGVATSLLGAAMLAPTAHGRVQSALARAVASGSAPDAFVAPLLGLGTREGEIDPIDLVPEAARSFAPVPLTETAFAVLEGRDASVLRETSRDSFNPHVQVARPFWHRRRPAAPPLAELDDSAAPSEGGSGRRTILGLQGAGQGIAAARRAVARVNSEPIRARRADAYVVHSPADPARARAKALRAWASDFEKRVGRAPVVWHDMLSADPSLAPHELLAHTPCYLAFSSKLLILAGPTVVDRLWCVAELYVWRAMGGQLEHVTVVPVGQNEAERTQALSAFDAFHVRYSAPGGDDEAVARLKHAVQLGGISVVNRAVREALPLVKEAVAAYAAEEQKPPEPAETQEVVAIDINKLNNGRGSSGGGGKAPAAAEPRPGSAKKPKAATVAPDQPQAGAAASSSS